MKRAQAYRLNFELAQRETLYPFFRPGTYSQRVFKNPMKCDLDGLKGRILSNASVIEIDHVLYPSMMETIEEIFAVHQVNGLVTIEHNTRVVYGRI